MLTFRFSPCQIPFQGGTNEEVVVRMYNTLRKEGKEDLLKCYWYVGKDQSRPLNAVRISCLVPPSSSRLVF